MPGWIDLWEGLRIFGHGVKANLLGPKRYDGDAEEICRRIVEACWDEERGFYLTSLHNYPLFYSRDFGMCTDSLIAIGEKKRVTKTLGWALANYEKNGKITLILDRNGKGFNFPDCESPDSYAFLLHALVSLNDKKLLGRYKAFIEGELQRFTTAVVDKRTGLVKRNIHLGGMRDYAIRDASCYDAAMLGAISLYSTRLGLKNPLKKYDYQKILLKNYWTGNYFRDDLENGTCTGDANVAPLWFHIFKDKEENKLFEKIRVKFRRRQLDVPYPLRYEEDEARTRMLWLDSLMSGWERDTVWLHLGNMWWQIVAQHDRKLAREYLEKYAKLIEREQNYPEVMTKEGKPHHSFFFHSDDSILWAANYLAMVRQLENGLPDVRQKRTTA